MSDHRPSLLVLSAVLSYAAFAAGALGGGDAQAQTPMPDAALHTEVDRTIRPGDDFYRYANGSWLAATPVPEGMGRVDSSSMLRVQNADRVRGLIEDAASPTPQQGARDTAEVRRKIGDFYAALLDTSRIEERGLGPLQSDLAAIAAISDRTALSTWLGRTVRLDDGSNQQTESLWGLWVHQGFHDPDRYAAHIVQGGLGLADTADYLDPDPAHAARLAAYQSHVTAALTLLGQDQPAERAARVVALESAIAVGHASRADTDDVFKTDNSWTASDFTIRAPGVDWATYFAGAGLASSTPFVVWQPQSVIVGSALVASQPLDTWKDYLAFHLVEHYRLILPTAVRDEHDAFEAALAGVAPAPADRSQQALVATEVALGDAVGRLYVERYVPPRTRVAAEDMVAHILIAYRARLASVSWMAPETKARALAKSETLRIGMAYPKAWIDYTDLSVDRDDAFGDVRRVESFTYARELARLGRPVDLDEWPAQLHPQMVGAILNISPNTMQFAAGLLQPPYFDPGGDAASNYGSAGAGLAHEVAHTFDPVSNLYDERGRLAPWWTDQDRAGYQAATARLSAQIDGCCPTPTLCASGAQVVGESAADLAGLEVAHDAYVQSLQGRPDVVKDSLTGEQRFFIAFAQRWRRQQSDASLQRVTATDNHAPPECRSNLARNAEGWVEAFDVGPGDALYLAPADRIRVW